MSHKETCRQLQAIRKGLADKLGIDLHQTECTYPGECSGTCPKCAKEEQILNAALLRRTATVAGLAAGALSLTACGQEPLAGEATDPNPAPIVDNYVEPTGDEIVGGMEDPPEVIIKYEAISTLESRPGVDYVKIDNYKFADAGYDDDYLTEHPFYEYIEIYQCTEDDEMVVVDSLIFDSENAIAYDMNGDVVDLETYTVPDISGVEGDTDMSGYTSITMDEAKEIFETPGDYIILDVRRDDEYAEGHIPGAINVANEDISDVEPVELPDKSQTIYVYCRSGNRSKQASEKLVALGYENIIEFGGIMDWTGDTEKP